MLHLGPIWYHSEPSGVSYSENLPRPISWFGLFLQQNDSSFRNSIYVFIVFNSSLIMFLVNVLHINSKCSQNIDD